MWEVGWSYEKYSKGEGMGHTGIDPRDIEGLTTVMRRVMGAEPFTYEDVNIDTFILQSNTRLADTH